MNQAALQWLGSESLKTISLTELSNCCGLTPAELDELVQYRALLPADRPNTANSFGIEWLGPLRCAAKLRTDFDLDLFSVALLLDQLMRIEQLQRQLQALQARMAPALRD